MKSIDRMIWVDLETTGLDACRDVILEIAIVITDGKLKEIDAYTAVLKPAGCLPSLHPIVLDMHSKNGLLGDLHKGQLLDEVDTIAAWFVERLCGKGAPLCGSSIHFDRKFIERSAATGGMPYLADLLGYRCFDVSALKQAWCNEHGQEWGGAEAAHRALDDVRGSIAAARQLSVTRTATKGDER